jgi:UDP-glucose 4-epimerase
MKKERKRVIVTGGDGFIGSHIVDKLLGLGFEVLMIDNKKKSLSKDRDFYRKTSLIPGCFKKRRHPFFQHACRDIADPETGVLFERFEPHYVIHCAALARIQPSFERPLDYFNSNVLGTLNLLHKSYQVGVKKFVYSASSSAYGGCTKMPLREVMKPKPLNPYAVFKYQGEELVKLYAEGYGLPGCSLRYFNVYGPRENEEGDYATVVAKFFRQRRNGEMLTVVPDGYQTRDFTWVGDVADANIKAMLCEDPCSKEGSVFNIGAGSDFSVMKVACLVAGVKKVVEHRDFVFIEKRKGEALKTLADNSRAREILGWNPQVSLEEGIKQLKKMWRDLGYKI